MSRLASLGLTTKLPKLKYNDAGLGGREGGRGATVCLSVIPPPPRLISQFTLMIIETEGEGGRGEVIMQCRYN